MAPKYDAGYYHQKSKEYWIKAREASEPRIKAALEVVAEEYFRLANEPDSAAQSQVLSNRVRLILVGIITALACGIMIYAAFYHNR